MIVEHVSGKDYDRSRGKRKHTDPDDPYPYEDIAWTAARCSRLLRSITCRLATLRRLHSIAPKETQNILRGSKKRAHGHWSTTDPVWLPGQNRKSQVKTYAAKSQVSRRPAGRPSTSRDNARASFPTPVIRRMGSGDQVAKTTSEMMPFQDRIDAVRKRHSRQIPVRATSTSEEVERGLEAALASLLNATSDIRGDNQGGRSTLLQTCLRRVPAYIDLYGDETTTEEMHDADPTLEVLSDLEALGTKQDGGWHGLRDVVRSLGLQLICAAITDGIVVGRAACSLINVCSTQCAIREGQQIMEAWLLSPRSPLPERIAKLDSFATMHRCPGFKYRIWRKLLQTEASSYARLCDLPGFENDLLTTLSGIEAHDAFAFLCEWTACSLQMEVTDQITTRSRINFESTVMRLSVVAIASSLHRNGDFDATGIQEAITRAASLTLFQIQNGQQKRNKGVIRLASSFILCAQLLALLGQCDVAVISLPSEVTFFKRCGRSLEALLGDHGVLGWRELHEDFASRLVGGLVTLEQHLHIGLPARFLDRLIAASQTACPGNAPLLKVVGLETVNAVKQLDVMDEKACHDFLGYIESDRPQTAPPRTPYRAASNARFRWEEGLCEWIQATPAMHESPPDGVGIESSASSDLDGPHTPVSWTVCSPDVLAIATETRSMTAQPSGSIKDEFYGRKGIVVVQVYRPRKRRRLGELSRRCEAEESGDELAF